MASSPMGPAKKPLTRVTKIGGRRPEGESLDLSAVKIAVTPAEKERIYRFRFDALEAEHPAPPDALSEEPQTGRIFDEWDETATLLYLEHEGEIVATCRLNWLDSTPVTEWHQECFGLSRFYRQFSPETLTISSQLFAVGEWNNGAIFGQLLARAYALMRSRGTQFDFRHCSPAFVASYEMLGYRRYRSHLRRELGGHIVPLVCVLEDIAHLEKVDSLLFPVARQFENHPRAGEWFAREVRIEREPPTSIPATAPTDALGLDQSAMPLFRGLSTTEIDTFLAAGEVITFAKGDRILRTGDVGSAMYLVLDGELEARTQGKLSPLRLDGFARGEVFGELAFLMGRRRTADVVALTDGKLLEITQAFLERAMEELPRPTMRFLYNLSVTLSGRLCTTTVQLRNAQRPLL